MKLSRPERLAVSSLVFVATVALYLANRSVSMLIVAPPPPPARVASVAAPAPPPGSLGLRRRALFARVTLDPAVNTFVGPEQVEMRDVPVMTQLSPSTVKYLGAIKGMVLVKAIMPGEIITTDSFRAARSGDPRPTGGYATSEDDGPENPTSETPARVFHYYNP